MKWEIIQVVVFLSCFLFLTLLPSQVGGVLCLVLNSQLFFDASACPELREAQEAWLEAQLSRASSSSSMVGWHDPSVIEPF